MKKLIAIAISRGGLLSGLTALGFTGAQIETLQLGIVMILGVCADVIMQHLNSKGGE